MSHSNAQKTELIAALQWHIDHGVDVAVLDDPVDRTIVPDIPKKSELPEPVSAPVKAVQSNDLPLLGAAEAIVKAKKLAESANTLDELKQAIADFDGLSVKKTATNMVFADGDPKKSDIMVIGEAPGADEDIQGKPFVGVSGQLLDKILACINLSRKPEDDQKSVYISNILNWRPPGNRTPTDSEISISMPFIEKHIALVKPKVIILCGGVAAKSLLKRSDSISKLRGTFHEYQIAQGDSVKMIATYHPAYLLRTPAQKKAVWADMLMLQDHLESL